MPPDPPRMAHAFGVRISPPQNFESGYATVVNMCFQFWLLLLQVFRPYFVVFLPLGMSFFPKFHRNTRKTTVFRRHFVRCFGFATSGLSRIQTAISSPESAILWGRIVEWTTSSSAANQTSGSVVECILKTIGEVRVINAILARVQTHWGERAAEAISHTISYKNSEIYLSTFCSCIFS